MSLSLYQVDTFTDLLFHGNPAAVCLLDKQLPDALLQKIATENNLSETAFLLSKKERAHLRWFTPTTEVDLCGHATLATAHVLFRHHGAKGPLYFQSKSGELIVRKQKDLLILDFPADSVELLSDGMDCRDCFGQEPTAVLRSSRDLILVFSDEATVRSLVPNLTAIKALQNYRGVIATAKGEQHDFVSRFFAPQVGVDEDPVTGSTHTSLIPYWAKQLGKDTLMAAQVSARGGELHCEYLEERVAIGGQAKTYLEGQIPL